MKFKNLSLVFVFVFIASLVVFSLCRQAEVPTEPKPNYSFEWHIPASIQARYSETLNEIKLDLEKKFNDLIEGVRNNHQGNNSQDIGESLASHTTTFYEEPGKPVSGPDEIADYFSRHNGRPFNVGNQVVKIYCFDLERPGISADVSGQDAIDFMAVIRFNHEFGNSGQVQDPPGDILYFHRKICTWI